MDTSSASHSPPRLWHPADLLPGMASGALQVALGHPFDTVKTRVQARNDATANRLRSWAAASALYHAEGVRGFYRGALPPVVLTASKRGVQLLIWERVTPLARGNTFVAGAIAGVGGTLVGCPLHVVKIHAQTHPTARSSWSAAKDLVTHHGLRSFYRGFGAHALRDAAFAGVYLGMYGHLRQSLPHDMRLRIPTAAAIASVIVWVALQPLDTLKTMRQSGLSHRDCVTQVVRWSETMEPTQRFRHVCRRLWRGIGPAVMRAGPVNACGMAAYEAIRGLVNKS